VIVESQKTEDLSLDMRMEIHIAASTNGMAGQLPGSKKPLKTSCFQGLCLVAGIGFEPMTFRL
jgi:hypothetical protein